MTSEKKLPKQPVCWRWPLPPYTEKIDDLYAWHAMRCAICRDGPNIEPDHDHDTGLLRGWLCPSCNHTEAQRGDGVFALYRQRPPAVIFGIEVRYRQPGSRGPGKPDPMKRYRGA